jgi:type II secretory pathway pseudopilin PulG
MRRTERGMTIIELIVMVCIVTVLLVIGVLHLMRARARGNEASAIASLRVIAQGQIVYSVSCGNGGFATNLLTLGRPAPGSDQPFVPPDLGAALVSLKSGYLLTMRPARDGKPYKVDCHGAVNTSAFYASARPVTYGPGGGTQSYAVSLNGVVWAVDAPVPPSEPFGPPAYPYR